MTQQRGIELAALFYAEVVRPIVIDIPHSAALLGEGSEVLGFDTDRSHDHAWGPRCQVFVDPANVERARAQMAVQLPETFAGLPTRFFRWQTGEVEHHVEIDTLAAWMTGWIGFDPTSGMTNTRWLTTPQQLLLEVTRGAVFRDDDGSLTSLRDSLRWYPHDVWLLIMARQWNGIAELEPFIGRTEDVGDEFGSHLVTAKLTRTIVGMCFMQERTYAPYDKWLGSAFAELDLPDSLRSDVAQLLDATSFNDRQNALVRTLQTLAARHNALGLTSHVDEALGPFDVHINGAQRPYQVLNAGRFAGACRDAILDDRLRPLHAVGSADQLLTMTDTLVHFSDWPRRLAELYESPTD